MHLTYLLTANQLNVEGDTVDKFAVVHSQLQIVSCIHVKNLEANYFTFMQIFQKRLLTKMRETVTAMSKLRVSGCCRKTASLS